MTMSLIAPFAIGVGILLVLALGVFGLFKAFYKKVDQGTALIVNDMSAQPKVHFTGALIIPVLYKAEHMRISLITLQVDRRGKEGLVCRDNLRADITVAFYLRVNETQADVLRVAKAIGADRASDKDAVDELFNAKFSEALKTVGKKFDFTDLFEQRQQFRDEIILVIGQDLNGYVLEDVAIDYLEQTPKHLLDPNNILDAQGIRKITELTAVQNIKTNELEQDEKLSITKKNTDAREAMLALERQQAEAEARQKREVESVRAREEAETAKVREEQRLVAERARLDAEEQINIRAQDQLRQVEIAEQNRARAVAIEQERVARARQMEQVTTDREVQLQGVERDKAVEQGRMDVANIVRERTMIDQTVAIAEEKIKETREVAEADRLKQVAILAAEADAQEALLKEVKSAEAAEAAARHRAVQMTTLAQAELESAGKSAEAKKMLADAIRAEEAASGLAEVQVKEATAAAIEKTGIAEARVIEAKADANYKQGSIEAKVLSERMAAEAQGLTSKFDAMGKMSPDARSHEEYRMGLETALKQALASLEAGRAVSRENAEILAQALKGANIELIGGDGGVFDALTKGISLGKAIEGMSDNSPVLQQLLARFGGISPAAAADARKRLPERDA